MTKIFCIGANKTGTTSLTKALAILGYKVCPESIMFDVRSKYFLQVHEKNYTEIFKVVLQYDAFEDRPWNHTDFYKSLDSTFTDSKFILTIRDSDKWIKSYRRWSSKIGLKRQWFYKLISQTCYGIDDILSDENIMREKYEQRNIEIIEYFKNTNKLLVVDFEKNSSWDSICTFLNKPIPKFNFPHLNRTK